MYVGIHKCECSSSQTLREAAAQLYAGIWFLTDLIDIEQLFYVLTGYSQFEQPLYEQP